MESSPHWRETARVPTVAQCFTENLKRALARSSLTQEQVAVRAGIDRTQMTKLAKGTQVPRVDTMIKLEAALGPGASALIEGSSGIQLWVPAASSSMSGRGRKKAVRRSGPPENRGCRRTSTALSSRVPIITPPGEHKTNHAARIEVIRSRWHDSATARPSTGGKRAPCIAQPPDIDYVAQVIDRRATAPNSSWPLYRARVL